MVSNKIAQLGFTLIEVLVVVALAAILAAMSKPMYCDFVQKNRTFSATGQFVNSLHFARSESVKRGSSVNVCPASNSSATACGNANNWSNGWIVYSDSDEDNTINNASDRIKIFPELSNGGAITTSFNQIRYNNFGFVTVGSGNYALNTTSCNTVSSKQITLTVSGQVRVAPMTTAALP